MHRLIRFDLSRLASRANVFGLLLALVALLPLAGCGAASGGIRCGGASASGASAMAARAAGAGIPLAAQHLATQHLAAQHLAAQHLAAQHLAAQHLAAQQSTPLAPRAAADLGHLTIGLTYVPNIQFAPFYVADALGYYKDAGLSVTLRHHGASEDEFSAILAGREDAIFAGGDEVLQARSRGAPLVDIATVFTKYPVTAVFAAGAPIHAAADLKGCTIGIPGKYGASYIGLLALLHSANLKESDVQIESIGFTQVTALLTHKVDVVMGYLNNEPIQFQKAGFAIRTLDVASAQPLISNGLAAAESELASHPDQMKALVAATLRGVQYALANPQDTVTLSEKYVTGLSDPTQAAGALAVLQATLPLWQSNGARPGYNDPAAWQSMDSFLQSAGQLAGSVDASKAFSNDYLPA